MIGERDTVEARHLQLGDVIVDGSSYYELDRHPERYMPLNGITRIKVASRQLWTRMYHLDEKVTILARKTVMS